MCHLLLVHLPGTWKRSSNVGRQGRLSDLKSHPGFRSQVSEIAKSSCACEICKQESPLLNLPVPSRNMTLQLGPWGFLQCLSALLSPLRIWMSWLCTEREEGLSYRGGSTAQSYTETWQQKMLGAAKQKGMKKEMWRKKNKTTQLSSFYPLDQEVKVHFSFCSASSSSLQCLQWFPDLVGQPHDTIPWRSSKAIWILSWATHCR